MLYLLTGYAEVWAPLRLFDYVTFRAAGAVFTALLITLLLGPKMSVWLKAFRSYAPTRLGGLVDEKFIDRNKDKTPSMGGLLIVGAILISTVLWANMTNPLVIVFLEVMVALSLLGFLDDYAKVAHGKRDGIPGKLKLFFQVLIAAGAVLFLWSSATQTEQISDLMVPFLKNPVTIPNAALDAFAREVCNFNAIVKNGILAAALAFFISTLTVVGSSNAVNLTDGKDGLAAGCMIICAGSYLLIAYLSSHMVFANHLLIPFIPAAAEVVVFTAALVGACIGYLWWNCHPASMFMGDTGSLALGGCIGLIAVLVRQELILIIIGGVFVMEAGSVILQVFWFKRTGRRIFLCSPIHHHFEQKNWTETQIVTRFWIIAMVLALIGLTTLKLR